MFDRFLLVWICRFPLPLDVWEGLRFVIVAIPGLFSYRFCSSVDLVRILNTKIIILQVTFNAGLLVNIQVLVQLKLQMSLTPKKVIVIRKAI